MQIEKLRSLIRESVQNHIKEIEAVAEAAAMDARLAEYDKAIKTCEDKITTAENLEEVKDLMDTGKINELKKKLKDLKNKKEKLEKQKAKKNKGKEVTTDAETDKEETVDETYVEETAVEETYTMDEMENDSMKEEALNESFLKMQKLAGVITEGQYRKKVQMLNEEITVGGVHTASMPTSSDGKERIDIKVKVLGKDRSDEDKFVVTPLEDKDYTNPVSGQQNRFEKGKQYGVEAKFLKETQHAQQTQMLNEGYKFNDANEDTAKEIKNKIKPAVEGALKKAMMDVATKNPELKGAPNYGLAIGLIAYDIVMDMA